MDYLKSSALVLWRDKRIAFRICQRFCEGSCSACSPKVSAPPSGRLSRLDILGMEILGLPSR